MLLAGGVALTLFLYLQGRVPSPALDGPVVQRHWLSVIVQNATGEMRRALTSALASVSSHPEIQRRLAEQDHARRTAYLVRETIRWLRNADAARFVDPVTAEAVRIVESGGTSRAAEARSLLELQAKRNDLTAIAVYGLLLETGYGGVAAPREAIPLYRRAARDGHPLAQVRLGVVEMRSGQGAMDAASAVNFLGRAALRGYAPAMYRLGRHYAEGLGVRRDLAAAQSWHFKAARLGHVPAQLALAQILAAHGTPGAQEDALVWLRRAATVEEALSLDEEAALDALSVQIESKLPVWTIRQAEVRALSKEWLEDRGTPELKWRNF
jgi:hypothetical protein